jgi:fatty-acyl-CoA synthase
MAELKSHMVESAAGAQHYLAAGSGTPLYHAGGLGVSLPAIFLLGGRIVLHDGFDASEVWHHLERERCTYFFAVPTIFEMLTRVPEWNTADVSHLRWCISGGAPLPAPLAALYRGRGLVMKQGYGLTEAGVNCFAMSVEEAALKAGSIGRPMLFTHARLAPVSQPGMADGVGELCLRGPHVAKGWLHTGDLARVDEDGFYSIAGRLKEMLISGGVNIYPAEIEAALLDHPAIAAAAVVAIPDPQWGEVPAAFVVTRAPITAEELTAFLAARLARYKLPKRIEFRADLPRTSSDKIAKAELLDKLSRSNGALLSLRCATPHVGRATRIKSGSRTEPIFFEPRAWRPTPPMTHRIRAPLLIVCRRPCGEE